MVVVALSEVAVVDLHLEASLPAVDSEVAEADKLPVILFLKKRAIKIFSLHLKDLVLLYTIGMIFLDWKNNFAETYGIRLLSRCRFFGIKQPSEVLLVHLS